MGLGRSLSERRRGGERERRAPRAGDPLALVPLLELEPPELELPLERLELPLLEEDPEEREAGMAAGRAAARALAETCVQAVCRRRHRRRRR